MEASGLFGKGTHALDRPHISFNSRLNCRTARWTWLLWSYLGSRASPPTWCQTAYMCMPSPSPSTTADRYFVVYAIQYLPTLVRGRGGQGSQRAKKVGEALSGQHRPVSLAESCLNEWLGCNFQSPSNQPFKPDSCIHTYSR